MRNAARELAELLGRWSAPGAEANSNLKDFRTRIAKAAGFDSLEEHIEHAMSLLAECLADLDTLRLGGVATDHLLVGRKAWVNAILVTDVSWGGASTAKHKIISTPEVALLKSLASSVDQYRRATDAIQLDVEVVTAFCDEVEALVNSADDGVPGAYGAVLLRAVASVREVLNGGDPLIVARRLVDLVGMMNVVAAKEPKAKWAQNLRTHADAIAAGVVANTIFQIATDQWIPQIAASLN